MENLLLESSLRSALFALLIALMLHVGRIRSAKVQHLIWMSVMVAMLTLPIWLGLGFRLSVPVLATLPQAADFGEPATLFAPLPLPEPRNAVKSIINPPVVAMHEIKPFTPKQAAWTRPQVCLGVYLLGVTVMLGRLLIGWWQTRKLLLQIQPCVALGNNIYESAACVSPMTVGWIRLVIVLPANWQQWPEQKLDAVLTHERAHIQRRDQLVHLLALVNRSVFWFHPLAWWLTRKLSELAETACDAAVLRRGHVQADYAEYLIEFAHTVNQAGGRLRILSTAMTGSSLARRIENILQPPLANPLSRWRASALALTSLTVIVLVSACHFVRKQQLAARQPSMDAQLHERAEENQKWERERQALNAEAQSLSTTQAQALLEQIKADPSDRKRVLKLVRYYQHKVDVPGLAALTHWHIEHEPETAWSWNIHPAWDRAAYDQGKTLWLAQLKNKPVSVARYRNAVAYLQGGDKPLAEQILLDARAAHPQENWSEDFGRQYAQVLLGSLGPVAEYNVIPEVNMTEAHGKYAQAVRAKLEKSTDVEVLLRTAQYVDVWSSHWTWRKDNPFDFDVLALAQSLNERALQLQPDSERALRQRFRLDEMATSLRLRNTAADQLNPVDRMRKLRLQLSSLRPNQTAEAEAKARELLVLAQQQPNEIEANNALYQANLVLGQRALQRNDKRQAAQHLLAASAVVPTDWLRYQAGDMTLARQLVDWGEREAVAQYLERCAVFNQVRAQELTQWATQLRQGLNPDLTPFHFN